MKAELVPEDGGVPIRIIRDVTVFGRRESCDVRVDHPSLSRRHCVIVKTDGLLYVRDLGSTNGTKVKGQRIRSAALMPNDRLTLGRCKFRVYLGPDHAPSPSELSSKAARSAVLPELPPSNALNSSPLPLSFPTPSPLGVPIVLAHADFPGVSASPKSTLYLPESPVAPGNPPEADLLDALVFDDDDLMLLDTEDSEQPESD